ncbi:MAG: hypothetical protein ACXIUB_10170 [Wenzhouxiangella sp.]
MKRLAKVAAAAVAFVAFGVAQGGGGFIFYQTSFENPPFTVGASVAGIDGWSNGSNSGDSFVITDSHAFQGNQSLDVDNSGALNTFYSVRRDLGDWDGAIPLAVGVRLRIDSETMENRLYGLYLGGSPTATLGGTVLGLTISGDGSVRAGTSWGATYTNDGLIAQIPPGQPFLGEWLRISLIYDPTTETKTAAIEGPFGFISETFPAAAAPSNVNLGTDWFTSSNRAGRAQFDNLAISEGPITPDSIFGDRFQEWIISSTQPDSN